jgi:hypothetical protein
MGSSKIIFFLWGNIIKFINVNCFRLFLNSFKHLESYKG